MLYPRVKIMFVMLNCQNKAHTVATLQIYRHFATCQQLATNLSISSNFSVLKSGLLQCNWAFPGLLRHFETTCYKPVDNKCRVCKAFFRRDQHVGLVFKASFILKATSSTCSPRLGKAQRSDLLALSIHIVLYFVR